MPCVTAATPLGKAQGHRGGEGEWKEGGLRRRCRDGFLTKWNPIDVGDPPGAHVVAPHGAGSPVDLEDNRRPRSRVRRRLLVRPLHQHPARTCGSGTVGFAPAPAACSSAVTVGENAEEGPRSPATTLSLGRPAVGGEAIGLHVCAHGTATDTQPPLSGGELGRGHGTGARLTRAG